MNYRTLGRTGLKVSEVGYGAWGIGAKQWIGAADFCQANAGEDAAEHLPLRVIQRAGNAHWSSEQALTLVTMR